jgi:hypothetical protein
MERSGTGKSMIEQQTDNATRLAEKYPLMFTNPWNGVDVPDGWYDIVDNLCAIIQNHIDGVARNREWTIRWNENPVSPGQDDIRPVPELVPQVSVIQIKEKFGTLRFYYENHNDFVDGLVSMATAMTAITCETCGHPGRLRSTNRRWIRTLCDTHDAESAESI